MRRHRMSKPRGRRIAALLRWAWRKIQSYQDPRYRGAPLRLPDHWHGAGDATDVSPEQVANAFRAWHAMTSGHSAAR